MECHEGAAMIKTFRGMIADGDQETIVLHTNDGGTGYKIVKFQLMYNDPSGDDAENVVKIYKISQTNITNTIDFSDNTLLAAGYIENNATDVYTQPGATIIFDREIFNQDIYITNDIGTASTGVNYYIELEQIKLDLSESTVATLKDIRNLEQPASG